MKSKNVLELINCWEICEPKILDTNDFFKKPKNLEFDLRSILSWVGAHSCLKNSFQPHYLAHSFVGWSSPPKNTLFKKPAWGTYKSCPTMISLEKWFWHIYKKCQRMLKIWANKLFQSIQPKYYFEILILNKIYLSSLLKVPLVKVPLLKVPLRKVPLLKVPLLKVPLLKVL